MRNPEPDPLNAFLESQRAGGRVESSGEFTLALEKAREKLKRYQLADPAFYLLKIFQAGVSAGAADIDIRLTRNQVQLSFWLAEEEEVLEPQSVLAAMAAESSRSRDTPLHHLSVGLNASLAASPLSVVWARWTGGRDGRAVEISNQDLRVLEAPPVPAQIQAPDRGQLFLFRLTKPGSLSLAGNCADEHAAVVLRCGFAPVHVRLDGRPLRSTWRSAPANDLRNYTMPYYLVEQYLLDHPSPLAFRRPDLGGYKRTGFSTYLSTRETPNLGGGCPTFCYNFVDSMGQPVALPPPSQDLPCRAACSLPMGLQGPAVIAFVKHGVLIEPRVVTNKGGGAFCVLPGDDVTVDLSEFQVVEDDTYRAAVRTAVVQWESMKQTALGLVHQLPCIRPQLQLEHADKAAALGCCVFGPIGLLVGPLVSILARRTRPATAGDRTLVRDIVRDRLEKLYWNVSL